MGALFAPKSTAREVIGKLNAAVVEALADPAVKRDRPAGIVFDAQEQAAYCGGAISGFYSPNSTRMPSNAGSTWGGSCLRNSS
jgi:hypothetical protein